MEPSQENIRQITLGNDFELPNCIHAGQFNPTQRTRSAVAYDTLNSWLCQLSVLNAHLYIEYWTAGADTSRFFTTALQPQTLGRIDFYNRLAAWRIGYILVSQFWRYEPD